jgi:hypothetical protein
MPKVGAAKRPRPREGRNLLPIGIDAETHPRSAFDGFAGGGDGDDRMHLGPAEG